jgi:serine/threonine protein phosphatase 1
VTRISRISRCLRLPRNAVGRDFVVGDLHGHRRLLERELERIGFDGHRDRLLSVGDLIDRGPDSLDTLRLLDEPWFHPVLGNHELMLLNYLDRYASRVHSRKSYAAGGGRWVVEAASRQRRTLDRYVERLAALPLALHVEGDVPCQVMHGDLLPLGGHPDALSCAATLCVHEADRATSSRLNLANAQEAGFLVLRFGQRPVRVSERPIGALPLTYVGHSRTRQVTVHDSYVYIEQGVSAGDGDGIGPTPPTVIEHAQFAPWLRGVAAARGRLASRDAAAAPRPRDPIASAG